MQILFAFLLSIPFQARFVRTTGLQRDDYLATLMLSGTAAVIFIAPVAVHRLLFRFRVKDQVVNVTNALSLCGLASLSLAMVGAILLVSDWVAGSVGAASSAWVPPSWFSGAGAPFRCGSGQWAEAATRTAPSGPASPNSPHA